MISNVSQAKGLFFTATYGRNFNPNFFTDITKAVRILILASWTTGFDKPEIIDIFSIITSPVIFGLLSAYFLLKTFFLDLDNPISYVSHGLCDIQKLYLINYRLKTR